MPTWWYNNPCVCKIGLTVASMAWRRPRRAPTGRPRRARRRLCSKEPEPPPPLTALMYDDYVAGGKRTEGSQKSRARTRPHVGQREASQSTALLAARAEHASTGQASAASNASHEAHRQNLYRFGGAVPQGCPSQRHRGAAPSTRAATGCPTIAAEQDKMDRPPPPSPHGPRRRRPRLQQQF